MDVSPGGGRGEEAREKAVEQDWRGNSGRGMEGFRKSPWVRTNSASMLSLGRPQALPSSL